ncbi:hypothetical protein [Cellvibrio mixtus]|uniref:hypothetical protein n=1 Tax=Cellvibrio mixtus TaxID=39650 RepID=UPI0005871CC1|nr:hypothetical protein [Cellvibrio mixtus]
MTKRTLSIIAIMVLAVCSYFFYSSLQKKNPDGASADTQLSYQESDQIEPEIEDSVPEKEHEQEASTSSSAITLPSYREASRDTYVPQGQVLDFVEKNFDKQNDDPTGKINLMLGKAFSYCNSAPKDQKELDDMKQMFEFVSLENAENNGETQASIKRAEDHYLMCKTLKENYPNSSVEKFLRKSSDIGNPLAKTMLAAFYKPEDFDSWSEEKKSSYRFEMGDKLVEARSKCEPKAFEVLAHADRFEYGNTWYTDDPITESSKLAHLYAYNLIMSRKYSDGEQMNPSTVSDTLDSFKIDSAVVQAEKLYNEFCVD